MTDDRIRLDGKVAIVAGAGGDIGREAVRILSDRGAIVVVLESGTDRPDEAAVARSIGDTRDRHGRIDILLNVATEPPTSDFSDTTATEFRRAFASSVTAPFLAMKSVIPIMTTGGGGAIVNLAIAAPDRPDARGAASAAVGAAVLGMSRTAAIECDGTGIRVNCIAPGSRAKPADVAVMAAFLVSDDASFITGAVYPVGGAR